MSAAFDRSFLRAHARSSGGARAFARRKRAIALCGEGTLGVFDARVSASWDTRDESARTLLSWARRFDIPLLADPLSRCATMPMRRSSTTTTTSSGARLVPISMWSFGSGAILFQSAYSKRLRRSPIFRSWSIHSKRVTRAATTTFVKCDPLAFVTSFGGASETNGKASTPNIDRWAEANEAEAALITSVEDASFVYTCTREGCFTRRSLLKVRMFKRSSSRQLLVRSSSVPTAWPFARSIRFT